MQVMMLKSLCQARRASRIHTSVKKGTNFIKAVQNYSGHRTSRTLVEDHPVVSLSGVACKFRFVIASS